MHELALQTKKRHSDERQGARSGAGKLRTGQLGRGAKTSPQHFTQAACIWEGASGLGTVQGAGHRLAPSPLGWQILLS